MARPRHLPQAPITEALVDIRVKADPAFRTESFEKVKQELKDSHPVATAQRGLEASISMAPGGQPMPATRDLGLRGYLFKSSDGLEIVQFRVDGFTFNRLKPYTSWDDIYPKAMRYWSVYQDVARPEDVTRLALRYINRLPLPKDNVDFDDLMLAPPPVPRTLPQSISKFLTRVTIHDEDADVAAHITQALEPDADRNHWNLLLDIDAYVDTEIPGIGTSTEPAVTSWFRKLHTFKNRIFFESVTDEALEAFE